MPPTKEDLDKLRHAPTVKETKVTNMWGEEEYQQNPQYSDPKITHHKYNPKQFKMFGENKIAFARELATNHPELNEMIITKHGVGENNFELCLCEVAAYFEIVLDGQYTEEDLERLCGILLQKLVQSRTPVLFNLPTPKEIQ